MRTPLAVSPSAPARAKRGTSGQQPNGIAVLVRGHQRHVSLPAASSPRKASVYIVQDTTTGIVRFRFAKV